MKTYNVFYFALVQNYAVEAGVRELQRKLEAICDYIAVEIVENFNKEVKNYVITPESLLNIFGVNTYKNNFLDFLKLLIICFFFRMNSLVQKIL